MQHFDNQTIQLILIAVVVAAMLFQSIVLIGLLLAMGKAARAASEKMENVYSAVMPLISDSRALLERLTPKIDKTSDDLTSLMHSLRVQSDDLQAATNEIMARVRSQASRLDALTTSLLDGVDRAGDFMADAVAKPMRQVSAIVASIKAVVESLRSVDSNPRSHATNSAGDNDMFV